ncbi:DNA-binding protein [Gammaproteobacteria bacterium]
MMNLIYSELLDVALSAMQRYSETHPRPPHVNYAQAAEMLRVSKATVTRLVGAGTIRLNKVGKIPITEIDNALVARKSS